MLIKKESNKKYVIVEVHDAGPAFEDELNIIFSEIDSLNLSKKTILVTPYLDGEDINDNKEFIEMIQREKGKGAEIALHGYAHERDEFSKSYEEVKINLERASDIFYKAFDIYPKGFVPGYWKENKNTVRVLEEMGFTYTARFTKIIYFDDKEIISFPTLMVSDNEFLTFLAKIYSTVNIKLNNRIIRFTIHPGEVRINTFDYNLKLLKKVLDRGYIPVTYEELKTIDLYT